MAVWLPTIHMLLWDIGDISNINIVLYKHPCFLVFWLITFLILRKNHFRIKKQLLNKILDWSSLIHFIHCFFNNNKNKYNYGSFRPEVKFSINLTEDVVILTIILYSISVLIFAASSKVEETKLLSSLLETSSRQDNTLSKVISQIVSKDSHKTPEKPGEILV